MDKVTLNKLKQGRESLEGNFIISLYNNPIEGFEDFPVDSKKDLYTEDGKFYYNLGYNMYKKGIKVFDEITIATFLSDYPDILNQYNKKGGWKVLKEFSSILKTENCEAYYNALMKNNLLIKLCEQGFSIGDDYDILNDLKTVDEVFDFYDTKLNIITMKSTHDIKLEHLAYSEKDIEKKMSGQTIGLQFNKYSPLLNSFSNGIPRQGMTMIASYTNGGKTSFVFSNFVIPLVEQKIKVCVISNEQEKDIFQDLLCIYILTRKLDYWKINRNKLKSMQFTEEDLEYFNKARDIMKNEYNDYIVFEKVYDYGMTNVKRTIKRLANQGCQLFIYDTFKVSSSSVDTIWQSFLNDSRELFQISSKEKVAIVTPVQLSLGTKNHIRWLDETCLSNSKQIAEIYEEIFTFRDIWFDEYSGNVNDIKPYDFKRDKNGNYVYQKDNNQNDTGVKVPIITSNEDGNRYKIFFHVKSRNGDVGQTVLYQFKSNVNQWKELGICTVGDANK